MNQYVALLRGINFGGRKLIDMKELKNIFESLGFYDVSTLMNSGNVIFQSDIEDDNIPYTIEKAILQRYGFEAKTLVIKEDTFLDILEAIPPDWENTIGTRPHIAFLWEEIDFPDILGTISLEPGRSRVKYVPGALLWNVELATWSKDTIYKYFNTKAGAHATIRSINTVRKLAERIKNR